MERENLTENYPVYLFRERQWWKCSAVQLTLLCPHVTVDTVMEIIGECYMVREGVPNKCLPWLTRCCLNGS